MVTHRHLGLKEQYVLPLLRCPGQGPSAEATRVGDIVAACIALGAAVHGGPLSLRERALVGKAPRPSPSAGDLRDAIRLGSDPLGDAVSARRSRAERRELGAIYTPKPLVRSMVNWVLTRDPVRLVDAGCGTGRFCAEAIRRDPTISVVAVDTDPLATLVCRAVLSTLGAKRARVINANYTTLPLPTVRGRTAFVGNPPYVRHHRLGVAQKRLAKKLAGTLGLSLSALAGLHVHFFLTAMLQGRKGDVACFVTSSEWLDVRYGQVLRRALIEKTSDVSIHVIDPEVVTFDDAMTTAAVTCFEIGRGEDAIRLRRVSSPRSLGDLDVGGQPFSRSLLGSHARWGAAIRNGDGGGDQPMSRIGDVVRVSRGAVTGSNRFFVLEKVQVERLGLGDYVVPILSSAREVLGADGIVRLDAGRSFLLDPPADIDLRLNRHRALRRYLSHGKRLGIPKSYICRHRRPWWRVGAPRPPIVATYMTRQAPAFALNPDGLAIINVVHGLYPRIPMDVGEMERFVQHLNAHRGQIRGAGRIYHGGLEKFEPREMEAVRIPPLWRSIVGPLA